MKHFIGFELVWLVVSYVLACGVTYWIAKDEDDMDKLKETIKGGWFIIFLLGTGIYLLIK